MMFGHVKTMKTVVDILKGALATADKSQKGFTAFIC